MFGDVLQPMGRSPAPAAGQPAQRPQQQPKLISSDLDMSLQSLVQNLGISGGGGGHQAQKQSWGSPSKNTTKTGGQNWTVPAASGLTGAPPPRPMVRETGDRQRRSGGDENWLPGRPADITWPD